MECFDFISQVHAIWELVWLLKSKCWLMKSELEFRAQEKLSLAPVPCPHREVTVPSSREPEVYRTKKMDS